MLNGVNYQEDLGDLLVGLSYILSNNTLTMQVIKVMFVMVYQSMLCKVLQARNLKAKDINGKSGTG